MALTHLFSVLQELKTLGGGAGKGQPFHIPVIEKREVPTVGLVGSRGESTQGICCPPGAIMMTVTPIYSHTAVATNPLPGHHRVWHTSRTELS